MPVAESIYLKNISRKKQELKLLLKKEEEKLHLYNTNSLGRMGNLFCVHCIYENHFRTRVNLKVCLRL